LEDHVPKRQTAKKVPEDLGTVRKPLDKPQHAADLTVAQVTELKERRRLLERFENEANDAFKVVQLLRGEYQKTAMQLIESHGLDRNDDHNIDTDNGVIWRTATYVPVKAEEVKDVEVEAVAASNGEKG
jgi:hypothetical protein